MENQRNGVCPDRSYWCDLVGNPFFPDATQITRHTYAHARPQHRPIPTCNVAQAYTPSSWGPTTRITDRAASYALRLIMWKLQLLVLTESPRSCPTGDPQSPSHHWAPTVFSTSHARLLWPYSKPPGLTRRSFVMWHWPQKSSYTRMPQKRLPREARWKQKQKMEMHKGRRRD